MLYVPGFQPNGVLLPPGSPILDSMGLSGLLVRVSWEIYVLDKMTFHTFSSFVRMCDEGASNTNQLCLKGSNGDKMLTWRKWGISVMISNSSLAEALNSYRMVICRQFAKGWW